MRVLRVCTRLVPAQVASEGSSRGPLHCSAYPGEAQAELRSFECVVVLKCVLQRDVKRVRYSSQDERE